MLIILVLIFLHLLLTGPIPNPFLYSDYSEWQGLKGFFQQGRYGVSTPLHPPCMHPILVLNQIYHIHFTDLKRLYGSLLV